MGDATRPTKDIDLLGFGDTSAEALRHVFAALCDVEAPDDGLTFMSDTVRVQAIREGQEYGGMRIALMAMLGKVRIPMQIDVGAGDAVVPPPDTVDYPSLLDLPRARLRVYRPETSIAEKTEAMVRLALANSRMKDFFDIHGLAITRPFEGDVLRLALAATFERRQTPLPSEMPLTLTKEFSDDRQKGRQWVAFVGRIRDADHTDLSEVIDNRGPVLCGLARRGSRSLPGLAVKLLVDMNLSPSWVGWLAPNAFEAVHWSTIGAATALDDEILTWAQGHGFVVLTNDLDFSAILAATSGRTPSVVQLRAQDLLSETSMTVVARALEVHRDDIERGALLSIDKSGTRVRMQPLRTPRAAT